MSLSSKMLRPIEAECSWCHNEREVVPMMITEGTLLGNQRLCWRCLKNTVRNSTQSDPVAAPTPATIPSQNDNKAGAVKSS